MPRKGEGREKGRGKERGGGNGVVGDGKEVWREQREERKKRR